MRLCTHSTERVVRRPFLFVECCLVRKSPPIGGRAVHAAQWSLECELGRKSGLDSELWQRLIGRAVHDLPRVAASAAVGSGLSDWLLFDALEEIEARGTVRREDCRSPLAQPPKATAMQFCQTAANRCSAVDGHSIGLLLRPFGEAGVGELTRSLAGWLGLT